MDIIVSKIYDKQRFAYFIHLKYKMPLSWTTRLSNSIWEEDKHRFTNLSESEVRYLQGPMNDVSYDRPKVCKLKVINMQPRKTKIDVSPQPGDEPKQEPLTLFHVKFTKVIHYDEMLNERQIQALLKDEHVKSINIIKQ